MNYLRPLAAAAALSLVGSAAFAKIYASNNYPPNFTAGAAATYVPILSNASTVLNVTNNKATAKRVLLTYSAECSVNAPAGNTSGWSEIDIEVNGVAVAPTIGTADAFCTANGTLGYDGYVRGSITTLIVLNPGNNTVRIKATGQAGATGTWFGDSAIAIYD